MQHNNCHSTKTVFLCLNITIISKRVISILVKYPVQPKLLDPFSTKNILNQKIPFSSCNSTIFNLKFFALAIYNCTRVLLNSDCQICPTLICCDTVVSFPPKASILISEKPLAFRFQSKTTLIIAKIGFYHLNTIFRLPKEC